MEPETIGRFLVTAFFAVVFLQSAVDKLTDSQGNLDFIRGHLAQSPFSQQTVTRLFWLLALMELLAGVLCALGLLFFSFRREGMNLASAGIGMGGLALLSLMVGQRLAKDYAGAAVIAAYFAVALLGLQLFD
ncbi:MAG: DoxX family protein [Candidatus Binatia bacterium]